jgi:hypothetical protein
MCEECVRAVLEHPELLREYDRLRGTSITKPGMIQEIDRATGKFDQDMRELAEFIHEYIHNRVFDTTWSRK